MGGRSSKSRGETPPKPESGEAKRTAAGMLEVPCRVCEQKREEYKEEIVESHILPPFKLSVDRGA